MWASGWCIFTPGAATAHLELLEVLGRHKAGGDTLVWAKSG
jgi:hypothetical protein